jgi:transposase-like protein
MPRPVDHGALFTGRRFPPEIVSYAVWLPFRFSRSFRDVEERTTHNESESGSRLRE